MGVEDNLCTIFQTRLIEHTIKKNVEEEKKRSRDCHRITPTERKIGVNNLSQNTSYVYIEEGISM